MKKRKKLKTAIIVIIIILLLVGGVFIYQKVFKHERADSPVKESKKIGIIEGFNYNLYDNSTKLYKDLFQELKNTLEKDEIDYEKYAELISKLFVTDFYTLNNKITNQDIGGMDFIYSKNRENFRLKASDTLYKYVESNVYGDRDQELPEVSSFDDFEIAKEKYSYSSDSDDDIQLSIKDDESYVVKLKWSYKNKSDYQNNVTIRLVHEDKILSIVSVE